MLTALTDGSRGFHRRGDIVLQFEKYTLATIFYPNLEEHPGSRETYHMVTHRNEKVKESARSLRQCDSSFNGFLYIQFTAILHLQLHSTTSLESRSGSNDQSQIMCSQL